MAIPRLVDTDDSGAGLDGTIWNNTRLQAFYDTFENSWAWDTYTPAWTATGTAPVLGNGTLTGRYMALGKLYIVEIVFTPGSSTTFGTLNYAFSLPTAAAAGAPILGIAEAFDSGVGDYFGVTRAGSTTTITVLTGGGSATIWGRNSPMTWVNGDSARFLVAYRRA